jgi:biopolymer transport protein ExbD
MSFTNSVHEPATDINVTPLVDVMLVLLIIFMVTAPSLTYSTPLHLPQPAPSLIEPSTITPVNLHVGVDGDLRWNERALTATQLDAELRGLAAQSEQQQPVLQVQIEDDVPYERMVKLMARVKSLGLQKIRLD